MMTMTMMTMTIFNRNSNWQLRNMKINVEWTDNQKLSQKSNLTASTAMQDVYHVQNLILQTTLPSERRVSQYDKVC